MTEESFTRLRRIYDAFSRWDVDELLRDVTHDIELNLPDAVPFGGTRHGPEGVRSFARLFRDHIEGPWAEPDDFLDAGDRVVVVGRLRGRGRESGREFEVPFAHVWTLTDGAPSHCHSYFDTQPITAALEGAPRAA